MVLINGYCFCPELVVRFAEATCTQFAPNQVEQTTQRDRADPGSSMHFIKSEWYWWTTTKEAEVVRKLHAHQRTPQWHCDWCFSGRAFSQILIYVQWMVTVTQSRLTSGFAITLHMTNWYQLCAIHLPFRLQVHQWKEFSAMGAFCYARTEQECPTNFCLNWCFWNATLCEQV